MPKPIQIQTKPDPMAPFKISQGFCVGDMIFLSGQAAITKNGDIVGADDIDVQIKQVMTNIEELLTLAGSSLDGIVKVTIYVTDMASHFPKVMALRETYFKAPYPADTIVEVSSLALPELMIEIDVQAVRGQTR